MDQLKIGKFIAECRKNNKLTQMQLAEKLNITDRAVSKWENGKTMPDSAIMLELCDVLQITVNDLLNGEVVSVENYNKKTQEQLLEMVKQKEIADKRLLAFRNFIFIIVNLIAIGCTLIAFLSPMPVWAMQGIVLTCYLGVLSSTLISTKIQQIAGYYRCKKCGHIHTPSFRAMFASMDFSRWANLKCPKCGKRSWHEKVFKKD